MLWHVQTANVLPARKLVIVLGLATHGSARSSGCRDQQKSAYKFSDAGKSRWCDVGVWSGSRHANYLGEVMFWVDAFG